MGHAKLVCVGDLSKPWIEVYYMQKVRKETSSTSKTWVVFDASAKTASGTSLNDHLLVGPTVHKPNKCRSRVNRQTVVVSLSHLQMTY